MSQDHRNRQVWVDVIFHRDNSFGDDGKYSLVRLAREAAIDHDMVPKQIFVRYVYVCSNLLPCLATARCKLHLKTLTD